MNLLGCRGWRVHCPFFCREQWGFPRCITSHSFGSDSLTQSSFFLSWNWEANNKWQALCSYLKVVFHTATAFKTGSDTKPWLKLNPSLGLAKSFDSGKCENRDIPLLCRREGLKCAYVVLQFVSRVFILGKHGNVCSLWIIMIISSLYIGLELKVLQVCYLSNPYNSSVRYLSKLSLYCI